MITRAVTTRAVICPGHAVYLGGDVWADASWVLQAFQSGEPPFYVAHMKRAVELAAADPESLLIISGGQTRSEAGPKSEAQGYWEVADALQWFGHPEVRERICLEEFSRDSFENLWFSIRRFQEYAGALPAYVTVAGWAFKRERFEFHRETIAWLAARFTYVGVNNPADLKAALTGEQRALAEFQADPYGIGEALAKKRSQRNPFHQRHPYGDGYNMLDPSSEVVTCSNDYQI